MAVRRKKTASRKKKRPTRRGAAAGTGRPFFKPLLVRLVLAGALSAAGLLLYFDYQIQQHFRMGVHPEPAHLYARAPRLSTTEGQSLERVVGLLERRGYRKPGRIDGPGSYVAAGSRMDIFPHPVAGEPGRAVPVRLEFDDQGISSIRRHSDGAPVDSVVLKPEAIGSLQLGPYEDRIALRLHQMPELLVRALLAMEDRNFESHIGVDLTAIGRALVNNLIKGEAIQGGSTITQQLVKNLFLSPERSLTRKATEALMAIAMEIRYSKAEILELYLNEIFLGQAGNRAVHGFALASEYYFGRPLDQLGLHETATLVGMIPAPSYYNPHRHPERALARRNLVLAKLAEVGAITRSTATTLSDRPLKVAPHRSAGASRFPAYIDYLHRQVRQYLSEEVLRSDGVRLHTTLDPDIQDAAQKSLSNTLTRLEKDHGMQAGVLQGAAVVVSVHRGEILALVGDRQAGYSGFNRAVDAQRPIGSLVKPLVYLTALERPGRYHLGSVIQDAPLTLEQDNGKPWSPQNYDRNFRGPVTLLEALTRSYNVPTVRLGLDIGVDAVTETISRLGVRRRLPDYPSILLGAGEHSPLEVAQLYQSIANHGERIPLRVISRIVDRREREIARFPHSPERVIEPGPAYLIDFALKQVTRRGTAARLSQQFPPSLGLGGKTGTTDDYRDSWFAGYSGNLVTVVWVGRDDNRPIGLTGAGGAMRIWAEIMGSQELRPAGFEAPTEVRHLELDPETGLLARGSCAQRIQVPVLAQSRLREYAPCAGVIGRVHNWFNIRVGEPETGEPSGNDGYSPEWMIGTDNRR